MTDIREDGALNVAAAVVELERQRAAFFNDQQYAVSMHSECARIYREALREISKGMTKNKAMQVAEVALKRCEPYHVTAGYYGKQAGKAKP
jgi:uncharacterized protein YcbK (DUF882 family)